MNNEFTPENLSNTPAEEPVETASVELQSQYEPIEVSPAADETSEAEEHTGISEENTPITEDSTEVIPEENPYAEAPAQGYNAPTAPPVYETPAYTAPAQEAPAVSAPQVYYYPPEPHKKKGSNALIICLWVLIALFALGFFGMCGYILGVNSRGSDNTSQTSAPTLFAPDKDEKPKATEPKEEDDFFTPSTKDEVIPLPEKDDELYSDNTSVKLNPLPADKNNSSKYTTQYAYKKVAESTIGVVCYKDSFSKDPSSQGTGIVLSEDGYIATNSHVIGDSRSLYYVEVITNEGTVYEAKVIGYDSRTDLAVLKINAKGLTPAQFCDSEYVEVGQDVIAVGNPGGIEFQNSLTRGVVSALNRELSLSSQVSYIQTDAAINPGNSGGPLCNMYGQVIGINTAKISSSSYEGMGFAIPSKTVKEIVDDLISKGYVENRVRLGISGQEVSLSMQEYYDIPAGVLIAEVSKGGPCDGKGIETNDILTAIDDEVIESFSDIYAILAKHKPGDEVVLSVYKMDKNKTVEITITLMADEGETQQ
ncbi:MAG: trypsin-like peptidase domain-containing protein [Ruminococcus sp.]|nr:trypsin-like peptidase domain-containing protein [Ruminococcus sp.]